MQKVKDLKGNEEGLVTLAVDLLNLLCGYVLYQNFKDRQHPLVFGSITWKPHETNYSQPHCKLCGLYCSLLALRYNLWGSWSKIEINAKFLKEMLNNPSPPSAQMNQWLLWIYMFNFVFKHIPADSQTVPDGLSCWPRAENDTEISNHDIENSGKFIFDPSNSQHHNSVQSELEYPHFEPQTTLIPEETHINFTDNKLNAAWKLGMNPNVWFVHPASLMAKTRSQTLVKPKPQPSVYVELPCRSQKPVPTKQIESSALENPAPSLIPGEHHPHKIYNCDSNKYREQIELILNTGQIPPEITSQASFVKRARKFFLKDDQLCHQGKNMPRLVVLDEYKCDDLITKAHNILGHWGQEPTYQKLASSFLRPNMYLQVLEHC